MIFLLGNTNQVIKKFDTLVDAHLNWLNWFHFLILMWAQADCMTFLSPDVTSIFMSQQFLSSHSYVNSGILSIECFPLTLWSKWL